MTDQMTTLNLCACGCGDPVKKPGNRFIKGHNRPRLGTTVDQGEEAKALRRANEIYDDPPHPCECGCGDFATKGRKYRVGHASKVGKAGWGVTEYERDCIHCERPFVARNISAVRCPECARKFDHGKVEALNPRTSADHLCICSVCQEEFYAKSANAAYCERCKAPKLCACGCGDMTSGYNGVDIPIYVRGHWAREEQAYDKVCAGCGEEFKGQRGTSKFCNSCREPKPCECGCGEVALYGRFLHGHNVRVKNRRRQRRPDGFENGWERAVADELLRCGFSIRFRDGSYHLGQITERVMLYEECLRFSDGRWFIPDFKIDNMIVEVSGLAMAINQDAYERVMAKFCKEVAHGYKVVLIVDRRYRDRVAQSLPKCLVCTMSDLQPLREYVRGELSSVIESVHQPSLASV